VWGAKGVNLGQWGGGQPVKIKKKNKDRLRKRCKPDDGGTKGHKKKGRSMT